MFERYTEKARRVIFFARYEASQFGCPYIETEHLVLGLLREDRALSNRFFRSHGSVESIRKQIEAHTTLREKVSTSIDLPLSNECKRVLAYATEEAERLGHKHMGCEHLLLGLLREEKCFAAKILKERGMNLLTLRTELAKTPHDSGIGQAGASSSPPSDVSRDLIQAAMDGELGEVIGRDQELDAVIEVLVNLGNANPILVGERGAGKKAIVEALAQRMASGAVPSFLADRRLVVSDPQLTFGSTGLRPMLRERLQAAVTSLGEGSDTILFVGELRSLLTLDSAFFGLGSAGAALRQSPLKGKLRCIATSTPDDFKECLRVVPWLEDSFRAVYVRPLSQEDTLRVLQARKPGYEEFHQVSYADEALQCAAQSASRYLPQRVLPGKALDLLDAAGARVGLRQEALPPEIDEPRKRIKFIERRLASAVANHEFEKARFYSEEVRKDQEKLRELEQKYYVNETRSSEVSGEDVEEMISRWAAYPFQGSSRRPGLDSLAIPYGKGRSVHSCLSARVWTG